MQAQMESKKPASKKLFRMSFKARNAMTGYLFALPWLIGLFVFTLYPVIFSMRLSVSRVSIDALASKIRLTALPGGLFEVYDFALNKDVHFKTLLMADLQFLFQALVIVMVFSLIVAILLNGKFPLRGVFRLIFFMPVVILSGPVLLEIMGRVDNFNFMGDEFVYTLFSVLPQQLMDVFGFVFMNLVTCMWFSGVQILMFLAGLQKIDRSVYEAAEIDGAGKWECFWKITLPYMKSMLLINAVYTIIELANFSGTTASVTGDAAKQISLKVNTVNPFISSTIMHPNYPYSFSAAMSWMYFLALAVVLLIVFVIFKFFDRGD